VVAPLAPLLVKSSGARPCRTAQGQPEMRPCAAGTAEDIFTRRRRRRRRLVPPTTPRSPDTRTGSTESCPAKYAAGRRVMVASLCEPRDEVSTAIHRGINKAPLLAGSRTSAGQLHPAGSWLRTDTHDFHSLQIVISQRLS
jgi:hypothetical protein